MVTPEGKVVEQIIKYLKDLQKEGYPLYFEQRIGQVGAGYKKGAPDLWISYNGLHFEVEIKAAQGHRSPMQDKWKWKCETIWHIPYCCPHSFQEFKEWFIKVTTEKGE